MRESRTYGSVRGALSNERPYRDQHPFSLLRCSDVSFGSWSCENAMAEALTSRGIGEVAVLGHFAKFGGFSDWRRY